MVDLFINYWPKFFQGVLLTLELTFIGGLIAALMSPPLAMLRLNGSWIIQMPLRL